MSEDALRDLAITEISRLLPRRASQFSRLLARHAHATLPRTMATMLAAIEEGAQGITQLAEREGLTQPTATRMVDRLEGLGLATRTPRGDDRRFVTVEITPAGRRELRRLRENWGSALRDSLASLESAEIAGLAVASDTLQRVIDILVATAPGDANDAPITDLEAFP